MTIEQIKDTACKHFKVTRAQLDGKCRKAEVVYVKIAISKLLHSKGYKIIEIADVLGLHHATVLHHLKTVDDRMQYDKIFANTYRDFSEECD